MHLLAILQRQATDILHSVAARVIYKDIIRALEGLLWRPPTGRSLQRTTQRARIQLKSLEECAGAYEQLVTRPFSQ
jgi:hypothetical protein